MGIRGLLLFIATLALTATADDYPYCSRGYFGDLSGYPVPLTPQNVDPGNWGIYVPQNVCPYGSQPIGLDIKACSQYPPAPTVNVPDLIHGTVFTQWPAVVYATVYCSRRYPPTGAKANQDLSPVVTPLSNQRYQL